MAVKIRLKRMGAKKRPFYRVVVADARSPRDGRFIESVGYYDPLKDPKVFHVDNERIQHWMATGARPSDAVRELLERQGTLPATAHPVRTKIGPKRAPKPGRAPAPAAAATAVAEPEVATAEEVAATDATEEAPAAAVGVEETANPAAEEEAVEAPEGAPSAAEVSQEAGESAPDDAAVDPAAEAEAEDEPAAPEPTADSEG